MRIFLALGAAASMAGCGQPSIDAPSPDFHIVPGGFSRGVGPDGNSFIFDARGGLVVVDTGRHPGHVQEILEYAERRRRPIVAIVNTHWHLDHTTGNTDIKHAFPEAKVYATLAIERALAGFLAEGAASSQAMLDDPAAALSDADRAELERGIRTIREPDALLPDVVVDRKALLAVEGRDLELIVAPHAVSEADIWIWDPATKTAIVGDFVTFPAPFLDTACPSGWIKAFDAVQAMSPARIAPGHGAIMTADAFAQYRRAFENLLECAPAKDAGACAAGWVADAGDLLSEQERAAAPAYIDYYVKNVLLSPAHMAQFCPGDAEM